VVARAETPEVLEGRAAAGVGLRVMVERAPPGKEVQAGRV
jgi:hypothetical protein